MIIDNKEYKLIDFNNELTYKELKKGRELFAQAIRGIPKDTFKTMQEGKLDNLWEILPLYDIEIELMALIYKEDGEKFSEANYVKKLDKFYELKPKDVEKSRKAINDFFTLLTKSLTENFLTYSSKTTTKRKD